MKKCFLILLLSLSWNLSARTNRDNSAREFSVGGNAALELENISGDITITAGDSNTISIRADIEDDRIEVIMDQDGDRVTVETVYPNNFRGGKKSSVHFTVEVPSETKLDIHSISGNIEAEGISGEINLKSTSGDIKATSLEGELSFKSISGDVTMRQLGPSNVEANSISGDVELNEDSFAGESYLLASTSGDVLLNYGANAAFTVTGRTVSGGVRSNDDDVRVVKAKYGPTTKLDGDVNGGGAKVTLNSISGRVELSQN